MHLTPTVPRRRGRKSALIYEHAGAALSAREDPMTTVSSDRPAAEEGDSPHSPIVLVVDDDAVAGEDSASCLRRVGHRVRTAISTENACDFCESQTFDAVVLDHHLADRYTDDLLEKAPEMSLVVIVSKAASGMLADIHQSYRTREFAVLIRPVSPTVLVEVVQEAVTVTRHLRSQPIGQGAPDWLDSPTTAAPRLLRWKLHRGLVSGRVAWVLHERGDDPYLLALPELPVTDDLIRRIAPLAGLDAAEALVAEMSMRGIPALRTRIEIKAPHHRSAACHRRSGAHAPRRHPRGCNGLAAGGLQPSGTLALRMPTTMKAISSSMEGWPRGPSSPTS